MERDDIFDQRERWLEELREYVREDASVICEAGYMSLPAIADEIAEAALDPQPHDGQQKNDWISRAGDLDDSLSWTGPELAALVTAAVRDLHRSIASELLTGRSRPSVDDSKRAVVTKEVTTLGVLLDRDDALVAAWRDLIAACKNPDHTTFPVEHVKYLRDTVFALCHRRKQDGGSFGQLRTAFDVLLGSDHTVRRAQRDLDGLIPIKGVVGPWPSDVGSLLAMCLVRMRDPSALARRCSSRPLIAFDDPFDVPRRAVTRPLRRLVGQAHRVAALRRAPSAIPAGPVVAGAGFGNVRRGLRGRVRGASQSNSWAPSVA